MCGIIGYVGKNNALQVIIDGLERLEYRGYDSAGIAYINNGLLEIKKEKGKIENLKKLIDFDIKSNLGIGHTRWATHGIANKINSHPHKVGKITIVHNGIIENYKELKNELEENGYKFKSGTDTEVACALLDKLYNKTKDINDSIILFKNKARGAYALGIIIDGNNDYLYAVKKDSPLIIAIGKDENYIASDVPAIFKYTDRYIDLDDGDFAKISKNKIEIFDNEGKIKKNIIKKFNGDSNNVDKNGYEHYMLKEMHQQPDVIKATILPFIENGIDSLIEKMPDFKKYEKIFIVACGSAYHAGLVGKNLIEEYAEIPVDVEIASEFRYKRNFLNSNSLVIVVSQSGETADTLAALKIANEKCDTLGIINVIDSSIAKKSKIVLYTKAGTEIAVATTKAYSCQISMFSLIALNMAYANNKLTKTIVKNVLNDSRMLPTNIETILNENDIIKKIANNIYNYNIKNDKVFFIGRDIDYALSMEGSLKLKEISYINSQCYAAGELKHGTISLIDDNTPVIALVTNEKMAEKTFSNIKEVKARGAYVVLITTKDIKNNSKISYGNDIYDDEIILPTINKFMQPILNVLPLQMISYEVAKLRKCDIDKPKNLAKSVTVE